MIHPAIPDVLQPARGLTKVPMVGGYLAYPTGGHSCPPFRPNTGHLRGKPEALGGSRLTQVHACFGRRAKVEEKDHPTHQRKGGPFPPQETAT